jgi:hypothetical protein
VKIGQHRLQRPYDFTQWYVCTYVYSVQRCIVVSIANRFGQRLTSEAACVNTKGTRCTAIVWEGGSCVERTGYFFATKNGVRAKKQTDNDLHSQIDARKRISTYFQLDEHRTYV